MTVVNLNLRETALGTPGPIDEGDISVEYWAGDGPYIAVSEDDVTFPPPIVVAVVAGVPAETLNLPATDENCCVRWVIRSYAGGLPLTRFTSIPSDGPVDFAELPIVDPRTFDVVPPTSSQLATIQSLLLDGLTFQRVTQSEYDAIPTPRPTNVLYFITSEE